MLDNQDHFGQIGEAVYSNDLNDENTESNKNSAIPNLMQTIWQMIKFEKISFLSIPSSMFLLFLISGSKNTRFFKEKHFYKKKTLKNPQNLKKMFRKSPASNTWAVIFKNADFSYSPLKVTKLSKFKHFFLFCFHY